jgi:putative FmdB family regulatory protein
MPVFEYQCNDCKTKYEVYHKTLNNTDKVNCPKCKSANSKKLFSAFRPSVTHISKVYNDPCATSECPMRESGRCPHELD